jgi:guanylate kinase
MNKKYKVLALVGPAGAGKDTLCNEIVKNYNYHKIISYTTRPPRSNEQDGVDYYFVNNAKFQILDLIEYTVFKNEWFYGTGTEALKEGIWNIGVFNPEGIRSLKKRDDIELIVWYIKANPGERIKRQLKREKKPNISEIIRRYFADKQDFKDFNEQDNIVYNNTKQQLYYAINEAKFLDLQLRNKEEKK